MSVIERPENFQVHCSAPAVVLEPFLPFAPSPSAQVTALIVLNTPLDNINIQQLWDCSSIHVCADGGANRLYDAFDSESSREKHVPHFITGDCDSLKAYVRAYYEKRGTVVLEQSSQYSSDLMKALKVVMLRALAAGKQALQGEIDVLDGLSELVAKVYPEQVPEIMVYIAGGIGGRFDQSFQLINQLFAMNHTYPSLRIFFYSAHDVIFLCGKGKTYVTYPSRVTFNSKEHVPKCGILPFGRRAQLTTLGLLFDVVDWDTYVGGPVSSSNGVVGVDGFVIETTEDVVMNVEIGKGELTE